MSVGVMSDETLIARAQRLFGSSRYAQRFARHALVALAVGTFLAFLAPFDTREFGWPLVWIYWTGSMFVGWTIASAIMGHVFRLIPTRWPLWAHILIIAAALTPPMTAFLLLVMTLMGWRPSLSPIPELIFDVFVMSLAMSALGALVERRAQSSATAASASDGDDGAARLVRERLAPALRSAPILAISSEDHYLRVHTERGDELILMRLADALAALAASDGLQVHRSWWVARAAVAEVERADGRISLRLSNGVTAPVSRSYAPRLREAGWL